jgi:hypothetical protein
MCLYNFIPISYEYNEMFAPSVLIARSRLHSGYLPLDSHSISPWPHSLVLRHAYTPRHILDQSMNIRPHVASIYICTRFVPFDTIKPTNLTCIEVRAGGSEKASERGVKSAVIGVERCATEVRCWRRAVWEIMCGTREARIRSRRYVKCSRTLRHELLNDG